MKDYSNQELMEKKDELSIVMMLDKLNETADFVGLGREVEGEYLEEVINFTDQIKERRMSELFSNFKGYDVQATRREAKAEGIKEGMEKLICALKELRVSDAAIKTQLIKQYELNDKEADKMLREYLQQ